MRDFLYHLTLKGAILATGAWVVGSAIGWALRAAFPAAL